VAEVVLDDVLSITAGDQIVTDGETLESRSSRSMSRCSRANRCRWPRTRDPLLSGSFVVAGSGLFRATAAGRIPTPNVLPARGSSTYACARN